MSRRLPLACVGLTALIAPAAHACPNCYSGSNGDPIVILLLAAGGFLVGRTLLRSLLERRRRHSAARSQITSDPDPGPPK